MGEEKYNILNNEKFGRFMVAKKNIKAGELILSEYPTMVGPPIDGSLTCFNCCKYIEKRGYVFCNKCGSAILCSPKCVGVFHTQEECKSFEETEIDGAALAENNQVIFPLRCLFLRKYKPDVWASLMELEAHIENRRETPIWRRHKIAVEDNLRHMNLISDQDIASEAVQKICGILDVNTFELRARRQTEEISTMTSSARQYLRGLYPKAALMAHDCTSNTLLSVDDDFVLTVKASVDIPENGPIFFCYANVLHGSAERKRHLLEGKYFKCTCERCSDPTEMKTEMSSLKCHLCKGGIVRVKNISDNNSDWECSNCKKTFKNYLINLTVEEGRRRILEMDKSDIRVMKTLLSILLQTFHENHFLVLEIKQAMIELFAYMPPTKNNLLNKICLCQNLMDVFSKIEPGISRMKAMTLYQLQSSMVDLANKEFNDKSINLDNLFSKLKNAEIILKESLKHLLYEPTKSPEGKFAQMALSELKMLRTSIDNIKNDISTVNSIINSRIVINNGVEDSIYNEKKKILEKTDEQIETKHSRSNKRTNKKQR